MDHLQEFEKDKHTKPNKTVVVESECCQKMEKFFETQLNTYDKYKKKKKGAKEFRGPQSS
jgi:hypothetical protein